MRKWPEPEFPGVDSNLISGRLQSASNNEEGGLVADFRAKEAHDDGRSREKWSIALMPKDISELASKEAKARRMLVSEFVEAAIVAYVNGAAAQSASDQTQAPESAGAADRRADRVADLERIIAAHALLYQGRSVPLHRAAALSNAMLAAGEVPLKLPAARKPKAGKALVKVNGVGSPHHPDQRQTEGGPAADRLNGD
jgi:hypothetical protein